MKKIFLSSVFLVLLLLPQTVLATEKQDSYSAEKVEIELVETSQNITSRTFLGYQKKVTVSSTQPNFSRSMSYSEYSNYHKRFYKGTLNFVSSKKSGNKYVATYSGFLIVQL